MWLYSLTTASKPLLALWWRVRVTGHTDSIPPRGPAIVAANHSCFVDPWFLGLYLGPRIRFLITERWFHKSPLWTFVFRSYDTIPTANHPRATIEVACEALSRGDVIGVFPEGRISQDGRMQRFRSGICHMAARTAAPVLPVGIRGAFESLPRTRVIPRPGTITLNIGRPLVFPGSPGGVRPSAESIREFRERLFSEILRLSGQERVVADAAALEGQRAL